MGYAPGGRSLLEAGFPYALLRPLKLVNANGEDTFQDRFVLPLTWNNSITSLTSYGLNDISDKEKCTNSTVNFNKKWFPGIYGEKYLTENTINIVFNTLENLGFRGLHGPAVNFSDIPSDILKQILPSRAQYILYHYGEEDTNLEYDELLNIISEDRIKIVDVDKEHSFTVVCRKNMEKAKEQYLKKVVEKAQKDKIFLHKIFMNSDQQKKAIQDNNDIEIIEGYNT